MSATLRRGASTHVAQTTDAAGADRRESTRLASSIDSADAQNHTDWESFDESNPTLSREEKVKRWRAAHNEPPAARVAKGGRQDIAIEVGGVGIIGSPEHVADAERQVYVAQKMATASNIIGGPIATLLYLSTLAITGDDEAADKAAALGAHGDVFLQGAGVQKQLSKRRAITTRGKTSSAAPAKSQTATIAAGKWRYLFGKARGKKNASHNLPRTVQNEKQLARLGIFDTQAGRAALQEHLTGSVNKPNNIIRQWSDAHGKFETRESLLVGRTGSAKVTSTWEVMPDGGRRLTTLILMGGGTRKKK